MFKKFFKNSFGFGIIDALLAILILGIATKAFMDVSGELSNKEADYNKKGLIGFSTGTAGELNATIGNIAAEIRSSIIDSYNPTNKNIFDQGLCPYVSTPSLANGPGSVNLSVFKENEASGLATNWKTQENHIHITSVEHAECLQNNNYNFCLAYDIHDPVLNDTEQAMKDMDYILLVNIIPQQMISTPQGIIMSDIDTTSNFVMNIKNISYKIVLEAKTTTSGVRTSSIVTSSAWAGDLGVCTIGDQRVLPLADGYGDKDGNAIYNIVSYDGSPVQGQTLSGVFEDLHIQEGIVISSVDTGVQLQSKLTGLPTTSLPTAMNCAEVEFKCRGSNSNSRSYGPSLVAFSMDLTANGAQVLVPAQGNPVLSVSNGIINAANTSSFTYKYNGEDYVNTAGNIVHSTTGAQLTLAGSDKLDMSIQDNPGIASANSLCRTICTGANSYNQVPAASQYKGRLIIEAPGGGPDILNLQDPKGISCTACYMKNCSRYGLATFGKMNDMPNEPLDSVLPECAVKTPATALTLESAIPLSPDSCLKANWSGNDLVYVAEPCATTLPTLCYNFGKYLLAQDLLLGATKSLSSQSFAGAGKRCYEMGKEIIDSAELGNLLGQQGVNMVTAAPYNSLNSSTYGTAPIPVFQIMNLAKQGLYLAPESATEKIDSKIWFSENSINPANFFWTNLKTDSAGNIYAPVPFMHIPTAPTFNDTIAAYYSEEIASKGNFLMTSLSSNILNHSSGTNDRGVLLFNNLRFRGALSVTNNNPFGANSFRYLCRKKLSPFGYFTSAASGNTQAGGVAACNSEGAYFIPPITPHDWVRAMLLAKPNDPRYPFPDPAIGVTDISSIDPIWIAYQGSSNTSSDWVAYPFAELNQIINIAGAGLENVDKDGIIIPGPKDGIMCIENNSIDGLRYKAGAGVSTCSAGEVRFKKADLFGTNNLINRIMWLFSKKDFPAGKAIEI